MKCLEHWTGFEGICYYVSTEEKTFPDALKACEDYGGSLVSIRSQVEYDFITGNSKCG